MPGDIVFRISVAPHDRFHRDGNDLHHTMDITLKQALLGFSQKIRQLDGRLIEVKQSGVTQPDQVITIANEGMPHHGFPSQKGNMHVKVRVTFPSRLSDSQKSSIKQVFEGK